MFSKRSSKHYYQGELKERRRVTWKQSREEKTIEIGSELKIKGWGGYFRVREGILAQLCLAFSSIWDNRMTQQAGLFWALSFMLHRAVGFIVWPKGCYQGKYLLPIVFRFWVYFLILCCFFLALWWMSAYDFSETLRVTFKKNVKKVL